MKNCSVCDRTYTDEKLSFCTACGGALVVENEADEPAYDPLKTMVATPRPVLDEERTPPAPPPDLSQDLIETADPVLNPSWEQIGANIDQPIAGQEPSRNLAIGAMACGLLSVFCGLTILGPVGAILGFLALRKEKADPQLYGGRTFALVGIVSGIFGTLLLFGFVIGMVFYLVMGNR
jgi:hypothetical protein